MSKQTHAVKVDHDQILIDFIKKQKARINRLKSKLKDKNNE